MYGILQQKYLDSVCGAGHQSAVELLGKFDTLYAAANALMVEIGMDGEVDTGNPKIVAVMDALHDIDDGNPLTPNALREPHAGNKDEESLK